jgi:hypothetical protein
VPRCGEATSEALTEYAALREGDAAQHHVVVELTDGEWTPLNPLSLELHHEASLRWLNLEALDLPEQARSEQLRFVFSVVAHERGRLPEENTWLDTYELHVHEVCSVSASEERPVGVRIAGDRAES